MLDKPFYFQVNLRQLDMKLLCQLWALNESLQDYKRTLEDEDHQREVASILEAHLEDEEDEEEDESTEDVEANEDTSWPQNGNTNRSSQQGKCTPKSITARAPKSR